MKISGKCRKLIGEHRAELVFLLVVFFYYYAWARVQPYNVSPDEHMRYDVIRYIYRHGALPHGGDPEIRNSIWGISYGFKPLLAGILSACLMKLVSFVRDTPFALLMAARLVSVCAGTATVFFAVRIAKIMFPDRRAARLLIAAVAFYPNMAFLSSYINNDSLALCATAFITYVWVRTIREGWTRKNCVMLAAAISICALSYYNAYGFILCSMILFCVAILAGQKFRRGFCELAAKGLLITLIVASLCGWWFVRNYLIYDGDFLARQTERDYGEQYADDAHKPSNLETPQKLGMTPVQMLFWRREDLPFSWLGMTCRSFVGMFGYMTIMQPLWYYLLWWFFLLVGLLGMLMSARRLFAVRRDGVWQRAGMVHLAMLAAMVIPNLLNVYYSYTGDFQPQGRYSMPMFLPLMYFVCTGWQTIAGRLIKDREKYRIAMEHLSFFPVWLGLFSYFGVFLPAYVPQFA